MALAFLFEHAEGTQEQYDQIWEKLQMDNIPASGLLFHVEGPMEGGWRTVDVWESQEACDTFFRERLGPALQAAGVTGTIHPQVWAVHHILPQ